MSTGTAIVDIKARQIYSNRGHPGVETTVTTENGAKGVAVVTAGISIGVHEVEFAYDDSLGWLGLDWKGKGVARAVRVVEEVIAPKIMGMDANQQRHVDGVIIGMDDTPMKRKLGGNATASVSAAVLKAGANALGIPLYQHIGGANACVLPVPGVAAFLGSRRYGAGLKSGGKPSHSFFCYGFQSFSDASYAAWRVFERWRDLLYEKLGVDTRPAQFPIVSRGVVKSDKELWDLMVAAIDAEGYTGQIGIQVDVAAATYYDPEQERYLGIFDSTPKTREEMIRWYGEMVGNWPFVIIEDPLDEVDYEGHAILTRELGIEIVGDDLFTTNPLRVKEGIDRGACNAALLKVNQIGTISQAFDMVDLAYRNGYGVMPCDSRGEGEAICDYCVGLGTGHLREGALGERGNRFLEIEAELGSRARFLGKGGLKVNRWPQRRSG